MTQNTPSADKPLSQLTREQLYERVRNSSKDAVVLEEMQRLGFWPADADKPSIETTLINREAELIQSLNELTTQLHRVQNPETALKEMRKERMAKARERRETTKQKHAQERLERAQVWHERRQKEILYLGQHVSAGLTHANHDIDKLTQHNLPSPETSLELAQMMGLELAELRFLAYERRVSRICHYRRFEISKKTGGTRLISAPMPRLKRAQYWVLDNILNKIPVHEAAHGFMPGRSIASNATPHIGQTVVANLDLKNFFPSILYPRIKGIFRSLGYSEQISTVLGLLCTETPVEEVSVDNEHFFVANGPRHLPQGAPTSPMLTNILCRRLDKRLDGIAKQMGFRYTRYADDLTFSANVESHKKIGKLLWRVKQIIADEGFTVHPDKQHVMRSSQRQQVTGLIVNDKLSIDRSTMKRFRATLYQVEKDGPEGKRWNGNANVLAALEGYAHFICMTDPERGRPYLERIRALRVHAAPAESGQMRGRVSARQFRQASAQGQAPWNDWWQPALPSEPEVELTATQIKEQKTQAVVQTSNEATVVVDMPATQSNVEPPATSSEVPDKKPGKLSLNVLGIQLCISVLLPMISVNSKATLAGGIIGIIIQFIRGKTSWWIFVASIIIFRIIARMMS